MTLAGPRFRLPSSLAVMRDPNAAYARWRGRYGPTFVVRAVNGDVVCTADVAVVRDLFRASDDQVRPFRAEIFAPFVGPSSIFTVSGSAHRRQRALLMPPFHGARMRAYGDRIAAVTAAEIARWSAGSLRSMSDGMLTISLAVIVEAVFGVRQPERVAVWLQGLRGVLDGFSPVALFVPRLQRRWFGPWRRFLAAREGMDALLYAEIADRRRSGAGDDILSMLIEARHEDGTAMSDPEVRDALVSLLLAGHETTQISMAWALYLIHRDRDLLEALRAEVDGCDGSPQQLAELSLLGATVQETLRIDPIVPDVLRTLSVPMTLGDLDLPAGAHVCPMAACIHRDPAIYEAPDAFRPQRFIGRTYRPWEFLPFGGGTRRCVGGGPGHLRDEDRARHAAAVDDPGPRG